MKLRANKSGNKYQKDKITNYTVSIACSIVERSGLSSTDELTILTDGEGRIIIEKVVKPLSK